MIPPGRGQFELTRGFPLSEEDMGRAWSGHEPENLFTGAGPLIRRFLKGLSAKRSATIEQLGVHHMAAALTQKMAKKRGREALYSSVKNGRKSVYRIVPRYRSRISKFLAGFREPKAAKRGPGRPRKIEAQAGPKRGPGRPRKVVPELPTARRRGRPLKVAAPPPGRKNDFVVLPSDAMKNWSFWTQLVVMANEAVRRRSHLVLETDGFIVKVKQAQ